MQVYENRGERPGCSLKLTLLKQRAKWFLRTRMDDQGWGRWGGVDIGRLYLLTDLNLGKKKKKNFLMFS